MTLGQKIKKKRIDNGLSIVAFAKLIDVDFAKLNEWENDISVPDSRALKRIADALGCLTDDLQDPQNNIDSTSDLSDDNKTTTTNTNQPVNQTIIIHQKELPKCKICGKEIQDGDEKELEFGNFHYHKECYDNQQKEEDRKYEAVKKILQTKAKKMTIIYSVVSGVISLVIALIVLLLVPSCKNNIHPGVAVALAFVIGYGIFSMVYCILSGSYIGDVFVWCAKLSIKFPGLIASWDLDGVAWIIAMKILFAIIGFIVGLFALAFAICFSAALGMISFPFVLVHNIHTNYADTLLYNEPVSGRSGRGRGGHH